MRLQRHYILSPARYIRLAIIGGLVCAAAVELAESTAAASGACPNEAFRPGPSAGLPDCRAYELVTPEELGRSQDLTFTRETDEAMPSSDGEDVALEALTPLGTYPDVRGTSAVFSRTPVGWRMQSAVPDGASGERLHMRLFSPDLSQVALESATSLNAEESSPTTYEVGAVGGPYTVAVIIPAEDSRETHLLGANAGVPSARAFSDVVFASDDHSLLPPPEGTLAEETVVGAPDLYEWTDGRLRLVNVEGEGSGLKPLNGCGATLGAGGADPAGDGGADAISADGSRIVFTTEHSGPIAARRRAVSQLTVHIEPPRHHLAALEQREGVRGAGRDRDDFAESGDIDGDVAFLLAADAQFAAAAAATTPKPTRE